MIPAVGEWEELSRVTPLGLRFWDTLSGNIVDDGLTVTAHPQLDPSHRISAIPNRSGIYIFHNLPGLHDVEFGQGDTTYWSTVSRKPFVVEIVDGRGRFQRFAFQAELPFRDLFSLPYGLLSPPVELSNNLGIPLYSAPTRGVPSGIAVIRASLWDLSNDQPAAWAMMEAVLDGHLLGRSLADIQGRIALLFPYPEPVPSISSPLGSPPIGNRPPLVDQVWSIQLRSYFTPLHPTPEFPDLCQALSQPPAKLYNTLSPNSLLTDVTLHYGQELIVRSEAQSIVWIGP